MLASGVLVLLLSAALAEEPLYVPETGPPPGEQRAVEFVAAVIDGLDSGDDIWLRNTFVPGQLPGGADNSWYAHLARALREEGGVGRALRESDGPVGVVDGPDYTRVVLAGQPMLSLVVRESAEALVIDRIETTTCTSCAEPVRFASDLIAAVQQGGEHRLMPTVELDVQDHLEDNRSLVWSHWVGSMCNRNDKAHGLAAALKGAVVDGANDKLVNVRYADGTADTWRALYQDGVWRLHYASLAETSPLRMDTTQMAAWRNPTTLRAAQLAGWSPDFTELNGGLSVAHGAIGAQFHPLDGTLIIAAFDQDRSLSGVFRVDPVSREVLQRIQTPADFTNPLPTTDWYDHWHMDLSPDGRNVLMTLPTRLYRINLDEGRSRLLTRTRQTVGVTWSRRDGGPPGPIVSDKRGAMLSLVEGSWEKTWLGERPLAVTLASEGTVAVSERGAIVAATPDGHHEPIATACCGSAVDAVFHPGGAEVLLQCGPGCDVAASRVTLPGASATPIAGASGHGEGASWSPDGRFFTTHAPATARDAIVLWDSRTNTPIATFASGQVRDVRWSPNAEQVLTVHRDGTVWLWDVATVRQRAGL